MKKITLLMTLCLSFALTALAQETITLDFGSDEAATAVPTTATTTETECTLGGHAFIVYNAKLNDAGKANPYLFVTKSNGYVTLPTANFKVGSITVLTGVGASTAVEVELQDVTSGTAVAIEKKALNAKDAEFTWSLVGQEAGRVYRLAVANSKNAQFQKIIMTEAASGATLTLRDGDNYEFGVGLNSSIGLDVTVLAENLTEDIAVSVSGTGFAANTATLGTTGGTVNVTFTGSTAGTTNGTITFTSGSTSVQANLAGVSAAHEGSLSDPFDQADVTAVNDIAGDAKYWVKDVIAGCVSNDGVLATSNVASNLALGSAEPYIAVQLPTGGIREGLNLVDNASLVGSTVWVYGTIESYFSVPGVKNVTDYSLDGNSTYTAIDGVKAVAGKVYAANGYIVTSGNGEKVMVYNMTGKLVANGVAGKDIKVAAKGIYIVKVGNKATKVVVR